MDAIITVLLAGAVTGALTTVLAAMVLLAERYLVNYGLCTINVNEGARNLEIKGGSTLLESLNEGGIFIPSACGGRGTCAYCKVKITSGGGPVAPTEEPLLSEQEIASEIRISCQCKVRNDMVIEIPKELLSVRQYRGIVEQIRSLTHDMKELRIRLIEPERIEFVAGQYVQLEAPEYPGNPEPVYRAYSISSVPDSQDCIELIIRLVPGGICTTWVFEHLTEGDEVTFNGPYGDFRLTDSDGEMIWVAGGSGMAPFWSMIRHMKAHNIARPCRYFFGAVGKRDLFLVDELKQLQQELEWFEFIPALSGEVDVDEWSGERGLVTEVMNSRIEDISALEAYLCGSSGMIDAAAAVLKKMGLGEDRIFYDKFE